MKWRNHYGRMLDARKKQEALINVKRKKFAWWPVSFNNGNTVWLAYYSATYYKLGEVGTIEITKEWEE